MYVCAHGCPAPVLDECHLAFPSALDLRAAGACSSTMPTISNGVEGCNSAAATRRTPASTPGRAGKTQHMKNTCAALPGTSSLPLQAFFFRERRPNYVENVHKTTPGGKNICCWSRRPCQHCSAPNMKAAPFFSFRSAIYRCVLYRMVWLLRSKVET